MSTFTQRELDISNKSYTNKDFESIYLELLELAEKISKRFSPTSANEADPFIVLLKLIASVSDKINYNVDKNILERFLLSCTQESSMRELTDMLGYSMNYYRSAETTVTFKYKFTDPSVTSVTIPAFSIVTDGGDIQYITTDTAIISRDDQVSNEVKVIQGKLRELDILGKNVVQLENLSSNRRLYLPELMIAENGISISSVETPNAWKAWSACDNLNTAIHGAPVYKFAFDSIKNLPYLEFPQWIANIIGNGIVIKYILTDGSAGNIPAKGLKTVARLNPPTSEDPDSLIKDDDIIVVNSAAAISGAEPESMSDAYAGCKRLIGTFDNLVTCRDYANKIYDLLDAYGNAEVSNVQVSDRRTDINYATEVLTASNSGSESIFYIDKYADFIADFENAPDSLAEHKNVTLQEFNALNIQNEDITAGSVYYITDEKSVDMYMRCDTKTSNNPSVDSSIIKYWTKIIVLPAASANVEDKVYYVVETKRHLTAKSINGTYMWLELKTSDLKDSISPYDLCIYPLRPISNTSAMAVNDANGYNNSYKILTDESALSRIKGGLAENKTLSHDYKELNPTDIGYIQNSYKLEATINTAKKVSVIEQTEIISNINNALIAKYNPRTLRFGQEIAFDELLTTIEAADSRIKSVSLQEPEQTPKVVLINNDVIDLYDENGDASDAFKFIVCKNVLAGRVEAFKYDKDFDYSFFQSDARKLVDVVKLSTACNLDAIPAGVKVAYELNANEAIQFVAPKLATGVSYPYGINYYLNLNSGAPYIPKHTEYKLQNGDLAIFTYIDSNDQTVIIVYDGSGDDVHILKPNCDLYTTAARKADNETPTKQGIKNSDYPTQFSNGVDYPFYTLRSSEVVEYRTLSKERVESFKRCYWLTNQLNNRILWNRDLTQKDKNGNSIIVCTYILNDGEYFFYTDFALSTLRAFGPGTRLKLTSLTTDTSTDAYAETLLPSWEHSNYVSVEDIDADGLGALGNYFIAKNFSDTSLYLDIYENELITLTAGDVVEFDNIANNGDVKITDNLFTPFPDICKVRYQFEDDVINGNDKYNDLPDRGTLSAPAIDAGWQARAVLDLNVGPDKPQRLVGNQEVIFTPGIYDEHLQRVLSYDEFLTIDDNDPDKPGSLSLFQVSIKAVPEAEDKYQQTVFLSSTPIIGSGGADVNLEYLDLDLSYKCPSILYYTEVTSTPLQRLNTGYYVPSFDERHIKQDEDVSNWFTECDLYTSAINAEKISPVPFEEKLGEAGTFYTNTLYYHTASDSYYKVVRVSVDDTATFAWRRVSANPYHRMFMIYLENLNEDIKVSASVENGQIRIYNKQSDWTDSLELSSGINVVEVADVIYQTNASLCENITLRFDAGLDEVEALEKIQGIGCLISPLKVVIDSNPLLGVSGDELKDYLANNFDRHFKEFFICADLDTTKEIELSDEYKLNSAQAFYNTNNIANEWVMPKIDFPSSSIKIARTSKM